MGSLRHPAVVLAVALAMIALSGCAGSTAAPSPSPTWTPAPRVTAGPRSFEWTGPRRLRGELQPDGWTATVPFPLPGGPATVVGILSVPGSDWPRFSARLQPLPKQAWFPGYRLTNASLWYLPAILRGEGAITGWFPYALPAGRYRLLVRETSGGGSGGSYELNVAAVRGGWP